jgi:hypothetical protein
VLSFELSKHLDPQKLIGSGMDMNDAQENMLVPLLRCVLPSSFSIRLSDALEYIDHQMS